MIRLKAYKNKSLYNSNNLDLGYFLTKEVMYRSIGFQD